MTSIVDALRMLSSDVSVRARYDLQSVLRQRADEWSFVGVDRRRGNVTVVVRFVALDPQGLRDTLSTHGKVMRTLQSKHLAAYSEFAPVQVSPPLTSVVCVVRDYGAETLSSRLRDRHLGEHESRHILTSVLAGLSYLHRRGIAHGDLRPGNVLFASSDPYSNALLADYGLPAVYNDRARRTIDVDDLPFAAPEQVGRHRGPPTLQTDMFQFGVLVSTVLGVPPTHPHEWLADLVQPNATAGVVNRLQPLIDACLSRVPDERPSLEVVRDVLLHESRSTAQRVRRMLKERATVESARQNLLERASLLSRPPVDIDRCLTEARDSLQMDLTAHPQIAVRYLQRSDLVHYVVSLALLRDSEKAHAATDVDTVSLLPQLETHLLDREMHPPDLDDDWLSTIFDRHRAASELGDSANLAHLPEADREWFRPSAPDLLRRVQREVQAASAARAEVVEQEHLLYTDEVVLALAMSSPGISAGEVRAMHQAGRVLGVRDHDRLLYPAFQFDKENGCIYPAIERVNRILGAPNSSWGIVSWWRRSHPRLDWLAPKDVLHKHGDHASIIAAALASAGASDF